MLTTLTLALLASSTPAQAALVSHEWCVDLDTQYTDNTGGDWWFDDRPRAARGMYVQILNAATLLVDPQSDYLDETGCGTFTLDTTKKYHVSLRSKAKVNGIEMYAFDDQVSPALAATVVQLNWTPTAGTTLVLVPADTLHGQLAIGMWMMFRNTFGISSSNPLEFYDDQCCEAGQTVKASTTSQKIITHEIGHAIGYRRDGNGSPAVVPDMYNAATDNCFGDSYGAGLHSLLQKEYQSGAAVEGWADFVVAWAYNMQDGNGCIVDFQGRADYNLDEGWEGTLTNQVDCDDIVVHANALADDSDWLVDLIAANDDWDNDGVQCDGAFVNRSTEYDWMRFWWDMLTDQGVGIADLANMYDQMNPRNWDPDGSTVFVSDDPVYRLSNAASTLGLSTQYDAEKHNGVAH